jgi:ribosomal protein L12E/L44/L45/RPP1/RPP2
MPAAVVGEEALRAAATVSAAAEPAVRSDGPGTAASGLAGPTIDVEPEEEDDEEEDEEDDDDASSGSE